MRLILDYLLLIYEKIKKNVFILKIIRKIFKIILFLYLNISDFITIKSFRSTKKNTSKKLLFIHSPAWGDYINWLVNYNIPSLIQKDNIPKLFLEGYEIHLYIYTSIKDEEKLLKNKKYKNVLDNFFQYGKVHIKSFNLSSFKERNDFQVKCLLDFMDICLEKKAYFLHSAPDFIFGNQSIYNALKSVEDKGACFSAPVARISVNKATSNRDLKELANLDINISNSSLVSLLFKYPHQSTLTAFDNIDINSTYFSGISIREINPNSYIVIHNLPSVFVGTFNKFDYLFFHLLNGFNQWDRKWSSILLRTNRLKICGSSDLFFMVELTKDLEKIPTLNKGMLNNDLKDKGLILENLIPNQFMSFWKSK